MDPAFPASSAILPHLRRRLGAARARGYWPLASLVRALGVLEPMPRGLVSRLGGTGDVFIAWFHGPLRLRTPLGMLDAPACTAMAWQPGMAQEFGTEAAAWMHSWIHLRGALPLRMAEHAGMPFGTPIAVPDTGSLERWLLEVREEADRALPDATVIEALVLILLRRLGRLSPGAEDALSEVRRIIERDPARSPALSELALLAGCTAKTLCTCFSERYGAPPLRYALGLRLEHADRLMAAGMAPGQAAHACGWSDRRQFSRCYRRRYGMPPSARSRRPDSAQDQA